MRNSIQDGPHRNERVVYSGEMGSNAGPLPILCPGDQPGAHWIEADIKNSADKVCGLPLIARKSDERGTASQGSRRLFRGEDRAAAYLPRPLIAIGLR